VVGNGAMVETEAPASRRKPPATATPSAYSHRARRRLYPILGEAYRCRVADLVQAIEATAAADSTLLGAAYARRSVIY